MVAELVAAAEVYIATSPWLAVVAVFVGGLLTASNPCCLAMIPLMMGFVAGRGEHKRGLWSAFGYSLIFVLGLAVTFVVMGMTAALAGTMYGEVSPIWNWVVAVVCVVMGLHIAGVLKFTIPMPLKLKPTIRGPVGAFVLGLLFGLVSAPCAAPMLVVVLTYLAGTGASAAYGALLLAVYALGHAVLVLVAGTSMGAARALVESKRLTRATNIMRRVAGVVIVLMGGYFIYVGLT